MAPPRSVLLDLTRLISRVGRGQMTGIDRVEAAYLEHFLSGGSELFGLVRTSAGFVLLDRAGMHAVHDRITGACVWGRAGIFSRLNARIGPARQRAESDLRRLCIGRSRRGAVAGLLARHLPPDTIWLNVGHTNLQPELFEAVHAAGGRAHVLVHDMIPLEHPEWQRSGTVARFAQRMRAVSAHADLVIYNSAASAAVARRHFGEWGRIPPGVIAHLGVTVAKPDPSALPPHLKPARPYFVTIGTIEPRKNHALLLDAWQELARSGSPPTLYVVGARGWNNAAVFARLDQGVPGIVELPNLDDGAMAALVANASAMLFPSRAEGFGLPPCEAVLLGTPVVASDLPVIREVLGELPIYADANDMYSWVKTIAKLADARTEAQERQKLAGQASRLPDWKAHFSEVLKVS